MAKPSDARRVSRDCRADAPRISARGGTTCYAALGAGSPSEAHSQDLLPSPTTSSKAVGLPTPNPAASRDHTVTHDLVVQSHSARSQ